MIKKKTVFVLGAGASAPYGFPLGSDLYELVWKALLQNFPPRRNEFADSVREAGDFTQVEAESFANHLHKAGRESIDEFLRHQPQYKTIGKIAIARAVVSRRSSASTKRDVEHVIDQLSCARRRRGSTRQPISSMISTNCRALVVRGDVPDKKRPSAP